VQTELPSSEISADEARQAAQRVLSDSKYDLRVDEESEPAEAPDWLTRIIEWILELFSDAFGIFGSASAGRGAFAWVIIVLFAGCILFLLYRLYQNYEPMPKQAKAAKPTIDLMDGKNAREWLALAEQAEAEGDWQGAIRCRHRVLVAGLLDRKVITPRPGLTAGEIDWLVSDAAPAANEPMTAATWLFKDTWYGGIQADQAMRDQFIALSDQVTDTLDRQPVGAST